MAIGSGRWNRYLSLALAAGLLAACEPRDGAPGAAGPAGPSGQPGATGPQGDPAPSSGFVAGLVHDGATPLAGATVAFTPTVAGPITATSGADGRFRVGPLAVGLYQATVTLAGYDVATLSNVSVLGGATVNVDVAMAPRTRGFIRGVVRFQEGAVVANAMVTVDRHGGRTATGADGRFVLEVPATTYTVLATPTGEAYTTAVANNVVVPRGGEVSVELVVKPAPLDRAQYVGSAACNECHANEYARWSSTLHNNTIRNVDDPVPALGGSVIAAWSGSVTLARAAGVSYQVEFSRDGSKWLATLVDSAGTRRTYEVKRTHGGGRGWRQLYHARVGGFWQVLPFGWNEATRALAPYHPERWFDAQGRGIEPGARDSFEQGCIGCHATGVRASHDASQTVTAVSHTEQNIGCEACHGPGGRHVLSRSSADIVNPRRLITKTAGVFDVAGNLLDPAAYAGFLRASEACGQCHSRVHSNGAASFQSATSAGTHEYPYIHARGDDGAYRVGEPLSWYTVDAALRWDDNVFDHVRSSKGNGQQWSDMVEAQREGMSHAKNPYLLVTCFDCHSPHGSNLTADLRQTARDNQLCLSCHGGYGEFAPQPGETVQQAALRHSRHPTYQPTGNGSARCVGCHMPRTAMSGGAYDISSHTFKIVAPHESQRMERAGQERIPNSCTLCHPSAADEDVRRYNLMYGQPAPVTP